MYISYYQSPVGILTITCDEECLTGLWFENQVFDVSEYKEKDTEILTYTKNWLDDYFLGNNRDYEKPLRLKGTDYQKKVWRELLNVPYGTTISYKGLANKVNSGPRAVGNAVGKNPIAIIIPCHRVIKNDGSIGGFGGYIDRKIKLLEIENLC